MIIVKLHKLPNNTIVLAMCDSNLIGKKFEEKELRLDLATNFYKGKEMEESDILLLMKSANILNFVGEEAINLGIKKGLIDKKNIIKIKKIPHAQVARM